MKYLPNNLSLFSNPIFQSLLLFKEEILKSPLSKRHVDRYHISPVTTNVPLKNLHVLFGTFFFLRPFYSKTDLRRAMLLDKATVRQPWKVYVPLWLVNYFTLALVHGFACKNDLLSVIKLVQKNKEIQREISF